MNYLEHQYQKTLFQWRDMQLNIYPQLKWMHAIVNSARLTERQGAWLKAEGKLKGVWDIFLPYPSKGFHGMYIEMKAGNNNLTKKQKEFKKDLENFYHFAVCYSFDSAKNEIIKYLTGKGEI